MDEGEGRPGLPVQVNRVQPGTAGFKLVRALAARVLALDRYLTSHVPDALESHVLGAEAGRPAVIHNGESLKEGWVEAFGVDPQLRRRGIGPRSSSTPRSSAGSPGTSCTPATKTTPTTSSSACNQPRGMSHVA